MSKNRINNIEEIINNKVIFSIIIATAFAFNICLFAPLEFFYLNVFDLWFTVDYVLPSLIIIFCLVFLLIFGICVLTKNKIHTITCKIIFAIFIGLYIQGNFLNIGYKVLDGNEIDWNSMIVKGIINTLIWSAIIIIPFIIKWLRNEKNFRKFAAIISSLIVLVQVVTLIIITNMDYSGSENSNIDLDEPFYLDKTNMFNLSEEENIIVFVSDTFEATYMNEVLEAHPEYKELLKDFTYFDNTTGASVMTYTSMPTILTGEVLSVGKHLKQSIKQCFDDSELYTTLIKNGYDVELYTDPNLVPYEDNNVVSNKINKKLILDVKSKAKLSSLLLECVLYKYSPHFLKSNFVVNTSEFNKISPENVNQYIIDDVEFNKELILDGIETNNKNKTYKLYHLNGVHSPYTVNENIEYDLSDEYKSKFETEKIDNQAVASLKILLNYVDELKKADVYDNTTIILLADHGFHNCYHVNLLVKKANETKDFSISHAPIAIAADFIPTILNAATNSKDYGKDIWDYEEDEIRKRYIYNYAFTNGDNMYNILYKLIIATESEASKNDKYYIYHKEYADKEEVLRNKK